MGFILTVLAIWGSMHLYVLLRVRRAAGLSPRCAVLSGLLALVLMVAPIVGTVLHMRGHGRLGKVVAQVGMVWAGAFFLFFSISLLHDLVVGIVRLAGMVSPGRSGVRLEGPRSVLAEAGLVLLICVYGSYEALAIRTRTVSIETDRLPADVPRVRIVQITDMHLGLSSGRRRLTRALKLVNAARPDVLVSTGDLVDYVTPEVDGLAGMLAAVEAPLGKYAVPGNHEYYGGLERTLGFTRRAGFTVLLNQTVRIRGGLSLVGFEDSAALRVGGRPAWDETDVLGQAEDGDVVVVLKHRPTVEPQSTPLMDLQLSGHTHGGQIFPFSLAVAAAHDYPLGLVELMPGRYLYTSRGTGTWGPPIRFLNPPEVTIIDLVRSAGTGGGT
jgi:predicted MPP superfamily phosphohydrolase